MMRFSQTSFLYILHLINMSAYLHIGARGKNTTSGSSSMPLRCVCEQLGLRRAFTTRKCDKYQNLSRELTCLSVMLLMTDIVKHYFLSINISGDFTTNRWTSLYYRKYE